MHGHGRRARAGWRGVRRGAAALGCSLALNAAGLATLSRSGALDFLSRREAVEVGVAPVSPQAWEAHRCVAAERGPAQAVARPEAPAVARPPSAAVEPPRGTVVDVVPSPDRRRPERSRFLAERDGTVARETRSRHTGREEWASPAPRPMEGAEGRHGVAPSGEEGTADERVEGRVGDSLAVNDATPTSTATSTATATSTSNATATATATTTARSTPNPAVDAARALLARGEGGRRQAGRWDPRLMPVGAKFEGAAAGGPSASVPPDVAEGEETWLNTRRFRYAEFYARVAAAIRREWDPNRAWNARDPNDTLLGRRTRNARFDLRIEPDGRLREALLVESSGLAFLDRECLRAIQAAAPFPNPPAGLVEEGGAIVLRGWVLSFDFGARGLADALRR